MRFKRPKYSRTGLAAVVAVVVAAPVGYALASQTQSDPRESGQIPAEECSAEVREIYADQGSYPDTFSSCPTAEEAREFSTEHNLARRNGMTQLLESLRRYGGPEDAETIAELEQELDAIGGPYIHPRNRGHLDEETPWNTVDDGSEG